MHVRFACSIVILLAVAGTACADAGLPVPGSPDFQKTPPVVTAAAGISITFFLVFAGLWAIRHPFPALGVLFAVPSAAILTVSVIATAQGAWMALICVAMSLPILGLSIWLMWQKAPFVGRSLMLLLLALASAIGAVTSLGQMTWTDPRAEYRRQYRQRLEDNQASSSPPATAPASQKKAPE